ncbi:hypothetical protein NHX12_003129 [Muraenolepis orangiensis]|uniref:Uncharacterized protein n=1 Tax=Muraenolepis orangiensis TaxID=630683 RepID=A0A9Q0IFW5_9TELE|nr:hypothetical protein NHX12_003129 [Muraenolepis orangiensis]
MSHSYLSRVNKTSEDGARQVWAATDAEGRPPGLPAWTPALSPGPAVGCGGTLIVTEPFSTFVLAFPQDLTAQLWQMSPPGWDKGGPGARPHLMLR